MLVYLAPFRSFFVTIVAKMAEFGVEFLEKMLMQVADSFVIFCKKLQRCSKFAAHQGKTYNCDL